MKGSIGAGLLLTVLVTALLVGVFGRQALLAGIAFGLVATALQAFAVGALRRGLSGTHTEFTKGFVIGTGLRFAGVALVLVAILVDRARFQPLPTALGYLGVVVPLLFLEVRFVR